MKNTTPPKKEDNFITIKGDATKIARGHAFMAQLRRGGKFGTRKSRRNEKQRLAKED